MGRTFLRQDIQIRNSDVYDDTLASGSTLESNATNLEDDLDGLRSSTKINSGLTNWYDAPTRTGAQIETDLADVEAKRLLYRAQIITDITVGGSDDFVVLSVAGSETPTQTGAIGAVTTVGAVAAFNSGIFGTNSLDEVAGPNAIRPINLVVIRDATTGDAILSGNKEVYGLLQTEVATDGQTFNDTTQQVQISFVIENATADDIIACPAADIQGKSINYSYVARIDFDSIPESAFLSEIFLDQAGSVDVTLTNAIANQSGAAPQGQNIDINITDTFAWSFRDPAGAVDILQVAAAAGGDSVSMNVATLDINASGTVDINQGTTVDSAGTAINLGVTAGQIDSAASLTVSATGGASDLILSAGLEIQITDANKSGSTYAGAFKVSETSAEWSTFETNFGEVSLINAVNQSKAAGGSTRLATSYIMTANLAADTDFDPGVNATILNGSTQDLTSFTFVDDIRIEVNGAGNIPGANAAANNDVYPGTDLTNSELKFEYALLIGDQIIIETFS